MNCICSHPDYDHDQGDGVCIQNVCGCIEFVEDGGTTPGTVYPKASADPYLGFYLGKKYTLEESA